MYQFVRSALVQITSDIIVSITVCNSFQYSTRILYLLALFQVLLIVDPNYSRSSFCTSAVDRGTRTSLGLASTSIFFNTGGGGREKKERFGEIMTYVFELREVVLT